MAGVLKQHHPRYVLTLLLAVNLLNYIDRQALYAVFPLIKADFNLSDTSLGFLGSAFMLSYMLTAPLFGWLGDRYNRSTLAAGGLTIWSLATMLSGIASSYRWLLATRSIVGIGEASFGSVSPGIIADRIPIEKRGRILSIFFLAIPVGSALGYILGGILGQSFGWQKAFMIVGLPGLLLTFPLAMLKENRTHEKNEEHSIVAPTNIKEEIASFLHNRTYLMTTLSMTAMTFALGGMAQWIPSFLQRIYGVELARGNTLFGTITVVAGIAGTLSGGWLGDTFQKKTRAGYLYVSAAGFIIGAPMAAIAILAGTVKISLAAIFLAEFALFLNTGPLNTVIITALDSKHRSLGFALNIFTIHALGDAISPAIIGVISDAADLQTGLLLAPIAIMIAAGFAISGGRIIAKDRF